MPYYTIHCQKIPYYKTKKLTKKYRVYRLCKTFFEIQLSNSREETSAAMIELANIISECDEETRKLVKLAEGLDNCIRTFKI